MKNLKLFFLLFILCIGLVSLPACNAQYAKKEWWKDTYNGTISKFRSAKNEKSQSEDKTVAEDKSSIKTDDNPPLDAKVQEVENKKELEPEINEEMEKEEKAEEAVSPAITAEAEKEEPSAKTEVVANTSEPSKAALIPAVSVNGKHTITVQKNSFKFVPNDIVIKTGDTVVWVNEDFRKHNFISLQNVDGSEPEIFRLAPPGDTWEHTFTAPGEYPYYCFIHSRMIGKITVLD